MTSGIITAFAMLAFIGITIWVFSLKRKEDFDEQANLPLDDDEPMKSEESETNKETSS